MSSTIPMASPPEAYRARRAILAKSLTRPLVIFSGHAPARNYPANPHHFRPGSSYTYFGGPPLEHAALLIEPESDGDSGCTLLRPAPGPDDALWLGAIPDDAAICQATGIRWDGLGDSNQLAALLNGRDAGAIIPPYRDTLTEAARLRLKSANEDELLAIINLRLCKDEHELAAMRRSAEICVEAHKAAMGSTNPGWCEADVAAAFMQVLHRHQSTVSFNPIISIRGEVLHASGHRNIMPNDALLLCDAGVEEPTGYASDVTRTYPVSGKWSPIQRQLYDTVERALKAAVDACVPGTRYRDIHDLSAMIICAGLVEADLLRGDPAELAARNAHALFYPHGVGHLIGLDVHDMEDFGDLAGYAPGRTRRPEFGNKFLRLDRDLEPGLCTTIEPGIYFVPAVWTTPELVDPLADAINRKNVDTLLAQKFGGIRIEHTICVRDESGPEVLSADLPTAADEVVELVGVK